MKLSKFLLTIFFITLLSLLYVHQQTEIFRLAYLGQKKTTVFQDVLDKNTLLRYNIKNNTSLVQIGDRISKDKDFQMPETFWLVNLRETQKAKVTQRPSNKENILARIFSIKRQAEAKTINP